MSRAKGAKGAKGNRQKVVDRNHVYISIFLYSTKHVY